MEKTVLVIEDSEADQFLAKHVLGKFDPGADLLQAFNGSEALEMLKTANRQPDIIFLDINMPVMDGLDFLDQYQSYPDKSPVAVMLSSSDQEGDREKSLNYPFVITTMLKPISAESLEQCYSLIKTTS